MPQKVDLLIIGGGVNGAGIARDAAGRGLSVVMCEKDDLAHGTSSRSGKLIHGGLRYLEYYEFRLVREALIEREVLLHCAPHIIWPMRFVLPHSPLDRPSWLIRLGLFLYDNLGGRKKLPGTRTLNLRRAPEGAPLLDDYKLGFEYSDCWVDDARLVALNALDAHERGATILTRTACTSARQSGGCWDAELTDTVTGAKQRYQAKILVNAGGPWVNNIVTNVVGANTSRNVRLVKGSHIVVPKFWEGWQAYLVQNSDKRVIFINPYEDNKALIGTTDIAYDGDVDTVEISQDEIDYLIAAVNRYFKQKLRPDDLIETFSAVRPLFDDGKGNPSAVTRDYVFDLDDKNGAPILNIFGGKITTYRKLAEHAIDKLRDYLPSDLPAGWTADAPLPGGDIPDADFVSFLEAVKRELPWLPRGLCKRYARLYGTRLFRLIDGARSVEDLGERFGDGLFEAELEYLCRYEWTRTPDDVLFRRTNQRLYLDQAERRKVAEWMDAWCEKNEIACASGIRSKAG